MCGIFAYSGSNSAGQLLIEGLKRLEHRGYDSAGLCVVDANGKLQIIKSAKYRQSVKDIEERFAKTSIHGFYGIAHTRWATHGEVNATNAHPHLSKEIGVCVVHNGIVENYQELKKEILSKNYIYNSQTDTEVLAHLVSDALAQGYKLPEAVAEVANIVKGANSFAVVWSGEPNMIVAVKVGKAGGIVITSKNDETFIANDPSALMFVNSQVMFLGSGEMVTVTPGKSEFTDIKGNRIKKRVVEINVKRDSLGKQGQSHFMAKEINEQPQMVVEALRERVNYSNNTIFSGSQFPLSEEILNRVKRVVIVAMGSSFHASMLAARQFEKYARIQTVAENAAEFRYREPIIYSSDLVIAVTQSGETTDTLAALELAIESKAATLAVVENEASYAAHVAHGTLPIRAGQEICVAATKTVTNTIASLLLFGLGIGIRRGNVPRESVIAIVRALRELPELMIETLQDNTPYEWATRIKNKKHILYIARTLQEPISMEGALKLKEVSYIHAESYSGAEMKHGVNALISDDMPVLAIAPNDSVYSKMVNNISEVKARQGDVYAITSKEEQKIQDITEYVLKIPTALPIIQPFLTLIPLQKLAYATSCMLGIDPDRPRNLAKTVTVE